jgi:hypothetical protein
MNATELTRLYILNEYDIYQDCKQIARSASNKYEAADLIIDYITEVIDEYRPAKGHGWGLVCDILSRFPQEIDFHELAQLADELRNDEA